MQFTTTANRTAPPSADEAEITRNRIVAARNALAEKLAWMQVPPVSGAECVQALVKEGFTVQFVSPAYAMLKRADAIIRVPLAEVLLPDVLATCARHAQMGPSQFMALLDP